MARAEKNEKKPTNAPNEKGNDKKAGPVGPATRVITGLRRIASGLARLVPHKRSAPETTTTATTAATSTADTHAVPEATPVPTKWSAHEGRAIPLTAADAADESGVRATSSLSAPAPTDEEAHAASGRSGSRRAAKKAAAKKMNATVRGAASSGEQRGATTGPRPRTRVAGGTTRGTAKTGIRRGSAKSNAGQKSRARTSTAH